MKAEGGVRGLLERAGNGFELRECHEELGSLARRSPRVLFQGHRGMSDSEDEILCESVDYHRGVHQWWSLQGLDPWVEESDPVVGVALSNVYE